MATNNSYSNVGCKEAKPRSAFMQRVTQQTMVNIKWHICISHALAYSKYLNKYAFTANVKYVNITMGNWRCSSKAKARRLQENLFECLFPLNKRRPFCMQYIKKTVMQIGAGYSNYFFIYYMWTGKLLSRINRQRKWVPQTLPVYMPFSTLECPSCVCMRYISISGRQSRICGTQLCKYVHILHIWIFI